MSRFIANPTPCGLSRREWLWQAGAGFAGLALVALLCGVVFFAGAPPPPVVRPKAKHVVFLFMNGAPSQVDTFDPKPALDRLHGTRYDRKDVPVVGSNGRPVG